MRNILLSAPLFTVILTVAFNSSGQAPEPPCVPEPVLHVEDIEIECADHFEDAQSALQANFENISAYDIACDVDVTDRIRVSQINWVKKNGKYIVPLDLEEITGKIEAFSADEYDYSVAKTQKLFHYCLLFKPGVYEVSYCVLDDNGTPIDIFSATKKQIITIGEDCNGCLGCLGCDGCAGCRDKYIPDSIRELELKRILSDWLLVGLCALGMMCWSAFQHH